MHFFSPSLCSPLPSIQAWPTPSDFISGPSPEAAEAAAEVWRPAPSPAAVANGDDATPLVAGVDPAAPTDDW